MEGLLLSFNWALDNGMNFVPQLIVVLLIGLIFAVRARSGPWMIALTAVLGIAWGSLAMSSFNHAPVRPATDTAKGEVIKTLTFNLHDRNPKHEKVVDYIWEADADVVCMQDALGEWRTAVSSLLRLYPHALQSAKGGTILMSKRPVKVLDVNLAGATPYSIAVRFEEFDRPVDLICLHLTSPDSPTDLALRNQEMGYLARTVFKSEHPIILMGDFNASTRSPSMFRFMQQAGVVTAGPGFPPANSWPGSLPILGIRLDHVLYSPPLPQIAGGVGPSMGSNHRPVRADLFLPKDSDEKAR